MPLAHARARFIHCALKITNREPPRTLTRLRVYASSAAKIPIAGLLAARAAPVEGSGTNLSALLKNVLFASVGYAEWSELEIMRSRDFGRQPCRAVKNFGAKDAVISLNEH